MIQLGITDFLLDLILDWDNVEDYTRYVPEGPEYEKYDVANLQPVVVVENSPDVDNTVDEPFIRLEHDVRDWPILPMFRGGGKSVREADDRIVDVVELVLWTAEVVDDQYDLPS